MKKLADFFYRHSIIECISVVFLLNLLTEILNHRTSLGFFRHIVYHPYAFVFNMLILLAFFSITQFFARRAFAYFLCAIPFLTLTITNGVILALRLSPLSAIDFYVIKSAFTMIGAYLKVWHVVLILAAFALAGVLLVFLFRLKDRREVNFKNAVILLMSSLFALLLSGIVLHVAGLFPENFDDMNEAYEDYGFWYSFSVSIFDKGVDEPEDFTPLMIAQLTDKLDIVDTAEANELPNVIYLQLESFFDVDRIYGVTYASDPIPNFHRLSELCPSGRLGVSTIGGGTANTEFEVLTGMNISYFGPGEYPYQTVLKDNTCESAAYILGEYGLASHAIHNHTGSFYDRHEVYSRLGFNTFTPVEYMAKREYNAIGWEKDSMLPGEIISALDSTAGGDFVFAVSVQAHGGYPSYEQEGYDYNVDMEFDSELFDADTAYEVAYYVSELSEMDAVLGELVALLEQRGEPTVLVVYGDHLPAISFGDGVISDGDRKTDYLIWSVGCELLLDGGELCSYQLSSYVLNGIGAERGIINRLHHRLSDDPKYQSYLEALEYDMLYGDRTCYGGKEVYAPTEMAFGTSPVRVTKVRSEADGQLRVYGDGFTASSVVSVNQRKYSTVLLPDGSLVVEKWVDIKPGDLVTVRQVTDNFVQLGSSEGYVYR